MATATGLKATLEIAGPVVLGRAALAVIRIANLGPAPVWASARLNLMEGDVALQVTDPGGGVREVKGWQADTGLNRVELPPGQEIVGAIDLLEAPDGPIFPRPGDYRMAALYWPGPKAEPLATPPVPVSVIAPQSEEDRVLGDLLADPDVRRALVLGDRDSAPKRVAGIAARFADTLEGRLARFVADPDSAASAVTGDGADAVDTALVVRALVNPYSRTGDRAAAACVAALEAAESDGGDADRAIRLLRGEPVPGGG